MGDLNEPSIAAMLPDRIAYTDRIIRGEDTQGNSTINQYSVYQDLGEGSFGSVKLVHENESQMKYAAKMYQKSRMRKQKEYNKDPATGEMIVKNAYLDVLKEIEIMSRLGVETKDNGSIVKLHEVIDSEKDDKLILIIDYAHFGEIMSWDEGQERFETCLENKKFFNETDIQRIMRDLVIGLEFLHSHGVVHRDIKPQNIMLDENGKAKFADFGSAKILEDDNDMLKDTSGTFLFLAPECCDPEVKEYSAKKADIWALGVSLYTFSFNKLPFWGETEKEMLECIQTSDLKMPEDRKVPDGLSDVISKMLEKDPEKRASVDEIKGHKWLNEGFSVSLNSQEAAMGMMSHLKTQEMDDLHKTTVLYAKKIAAHH